MEKALIIKNFGLTAINNRAILREGSLEFDSNKRGTSVTVEFKI